MKIITSLPVVLLFLSVVPCPAQATQQGSVGRNTELESQVAKAFSKVTTKLSEKTSVPLRFPTFVRGLEDGTELYAVIKSVDKTGYVVVLGATPDCQGQHVCSDGTFIGTSQPLDQIDEYTLRGRQGARAALAHKIKGTFYKSECGAYCSDALMTWSEGNYHYIIGIKAERKADLVRTANSAILTQPR